MVAERDVAQDVGVAEQLREGRFVVQRPLADDEPLGDDREGDHAISRYSARCAWADASPVSSARARRAPARAGSGSASTSSIAAASACTSPAGTTRPASKR